MESRLSTTLQRATKGGTANRAKTTKTSIDVLRIGIVGDDFAAAFAVCVLIGALWLLVAGYA